MQEFLSQEYVLRSLEPFICTVEWIALSYLNKDLYRAVPKLVPVHKKFKKDLLLKINDNTWASLLFKKLKRLQGVLYSGFINSVLFDRGFGNEMNFTFTDSSQQGWSIPCPKHISILFSHAPLNSFLEDPVKASIEKNLFTSHCLFIQDITGCFKRRVSWNSDVRLIDYIDRIPIDEKKGITFVNKISIFWKYYNTLLRNFVRYQYFKILFQEYSDYKNNGTLYDLLGVAISLLNVSQRTLNQLEASLFNLRHRQKLLRFQNRIFKELFPKGSSFFIGLNSGKDEITFRLDVLKQMIHQDCCTNAKARTERKTLNIQDRLSIFILSPSL